MLSDFQKEMLDEVLVCRKLYKDSGPIDWRNPEERTLQGYRVTKGKEYFQEAILDWLKENGVTAFIRFEDFSFDKYRSTRKIEINAIGVWNHIGALDNKGVLNKVYLYLKSGNTYKVRTHKARTDVKFLHPFEDEFLVFFQECMDYLNA